MKVEMTEHGYENLLGCITTLERRVAALEQQNERLWEVIKCIGDKR
jgi:hypothetical protein